MTININWDKDFSANTDYTIVPKECESGYAVYDKDGNLVGEYSEWSDLASEFFWKVCGL